MKTQQTKPQRIRNIGAAICAILLSLAMVALLAGLGSDEAQAETGEGDGAITMSAETKKERAGYYATVTKVTEIPGFEADESIVVYPGTYGRSSSGAWVSIPELTIDPSSKCASIPDEGLEALKSKIVVLGSPGTSEPGIDWWTLYKIVPNTTKEAEAPENKSVGTTTPEIDLTPNTTDIEKPLHTPEPTQKPSEPTSVDSTEPTPQPTSVVDNKDAVAEPEILSLKCRESEAEAKIAELEAQGYEIVNVMKLPKWYR